MTSQAGDLLLLAIDDGHESVWQYGYPLLERYDCRATVFLVVGYVRVCQR